MNQSPNSLQMPYYSADERIATQGTMPRRTNAGIIQKIFVLCMIFLLSISLLRAQNAAPTYNGSDDTKGFKKENMFIGGGINLGFATNTFAVGATPEIGYSIAEWLDAGVSINLNYTSERADPYYNNNIRTRSFNYGGGVFVRAYPIRFLFLQLQPEENWIHISQKDYNSNYTASATYNATSLIAGIGYAQRIVGQSNFYTMIGMDLLNSIYSPYRDYNNSAIPIIRAGFNIYLHPSRRR